MLPIYGTVPFVLRRTHARLRSLNAVLRAFSYAPLFMAGELVSGLLLRQLLGTCPWGKGYRESLSPTIDGLVRLDYIPLWALAAFLFEKCYELTSGTEGAAPQALEEPCDSSISAASSVPASRSRVSLSASASFSSRS